MWPNPQFSADLVTITGEIFNGKLHFCAVPVFTRMDLKVTFYSSIIFEITKRGPNLLPSTKTNFLSFGQTIIFSKYIWESEKTISGLKRFL